MLGSAAKWLQKIKPAKEWKPACLAPWVHSFLYTSGKHRLCCMSGFVPGDEPQDINAYWNGKFMKRIRRTLLKGELPQECEACRGHPIPHLSHFNATYGGEKRRLQAATSWRGSVDLPPISFDYRLSNLCNFKCRMCSPHYSSSMEKEAMELSGDYSLPSWQREPRRSAITKFQQEVAEQELAESIENKSIREIYWAGGEPLLLEAHWEKMRKIMERGLAPQVHARYNTNFSTLTYKGQHLFRDILSHFPSFHVSASLDATGETGEYLRTGLKWGVWQKHLQESLPFIDQKERKLWVAHCLTVPGLLDLPRLLAFCEENLLPISPQIVDSFTYSGVVSPLSPLAFPKEIRNRLVEETISESLHLRSNRNSQVFELLEHILSQPCWKETHAGFEKALLSGSQTIWQMDNHRNASRPGKTYLKNLRSRLDPAVSGGSIETATRLHPGPQARHK